MKLHLKFAASADDDRRSAVRAAARRLGAEDVRQLFPDEEGNELATLFLVDLPDDLDASALLDALRRDEAVEAVEPEAPRWLTTSG